MAAMLPCSVQSFKNDPTTDMDGMEERDLNLIQGDSGWISCIATFPWLFNMLRLEQNDWHFADVFINSIECEFVIIWFKFHWCFHPCVLLERS